MQVTYFWHKLHLYRYQAFVILFIFGCSWSARSQDGNLTENLITYDEEWIHYGFHIGFHSSRYKILYSDVFSSPAFDSLHSIVPGKLPGWKVGFVVEMVIVPQILSFRILPTFGFYEHDLTYRFTDGTRLTELKPASLVELPLLLKYKSQRRKNLDMYVVGGVNPAIEVAGKGDQFNVTQNLELKNFNVSIDAGIGFDIYNPLFKFSPEIRYTWGLRNMLPDQPSDYSVALKRLTYENIAFYITFEGGPSYLKTKKRKRR